MDKKKNTFTSQNKYLPGGIDEAQLPQFPLYT